MHISDDKRDMSENVSFLYVVVYVARQAWQIQIQILIMCKGQEDDSIIIGLDLGRHHHCYSSIYHKYKQLNLCLT
jgi:hypothetical protein